MMVLATQVVGLLARLVEERTGLHYAAADRELFERKVTQHATEERFPSLLHYHRALRFDDPNGTRFAALIEVLVVSETYFMRELEGLEHIAGHVVARWRLGLRTRIWCAGCATGEEPLSIAVLLAEAGVLDQVDLLATDLSERLLERARRGDHSRRALRSLPAGRPPWIVEGAGGAAVVREDLRDRVEWRRLNLVDSSVIGELGGFDVISCRNLMIYFGDATIRRLVADLASALVAGGILVVGVSESLQGSDVASELLERRGAAVYRRAGATPCR